MPVHYSLPPYYVCQCLAEMVILETNTLIYVSYSKQSATFFNVQFDSELWDMLMVKTSHLYDQPHPLPPQKMRRVVQVLQTNFQNFVANNVTFYVSFLQ